MNNTPQEQVECFSGRNLLGQEFQFWQTRPHAVILCDSVLADCIEKSGMPSRAPVENTILYQRIPTPRPAPKFVSKNAWQVQHDNQAASNRVRRETSSTSPCARSTTECITWRSRSDLDLRLGAYAQNTISNRICHCRREQDRRMQCVRWRIPKRPSTKLGKIQLFELGKVFLRKYSARLVPSTGQKDCKIALAQRNHLMSCQFLVTVWKRIVREVQSMDEPKSSTITAKRMNQRDMRKRKDMIPLRSGSKAANYTEILSPPSDGPKNIVNLWIRSWQLISHTQLRGKSVSDMRTTFLSASMVKGRNLDQWRKGQITHKQ